MKKLYTALAMMFTVASFAQQISNGGFENWSGTPSRPTGWSTVESATGGAVTGVTFKDTTLPNYIQGTASIRLKSDSVNSPIGRVLIDGIAVYGNVTATLSGLSFSGIPFTGRPDTVKFFFRYNPTGDDSAGLEIYLTKWDAGSQQRQTITAGGLKLGTTNNFWVSASVAVSYLTTGTPDSLLLIFASSADSVYQGSQLNLDDVRFVYNTSVGIQEAAVELADVILYPNPASEKLFFKTEKDLSNLNLRIYGLKGELISEQTLSSNSADVSNLSAGLYLFEVSGKSGSLLKGKFNVAK